MSHPGDAQTLLASVQTFVADEVLPTVAQWDREDRLPDDAHRRLLGLGLTGALVPAEYGGPGFTALDLVPRVDPILVLLCAASALTLIVLGDGRRRQRAARSRFARMNSAASRATWLPRPR